MTSIKILRIVIRSGLSVVSVFTVMVVVLLIYYTNQWRAHYTPDEMNAFVDEIQSSPILSNTFYGIYDKLNDDRTLSMSHIYMAAIWHTVRNNHNSTSTSWHLKAAQFFPKKKGIGNNAEFKLASGLAHFVSTEKCFDFVMTKHFEQLCEKYPRPIHLTQISDTIETLQFLVLMKGPSLYINDDIRLNKRISELQERLND